MKEQILDLERIRKDDNLCRKIYRLANNKTDSGIGDIHFSSWFNDVKITNFVLPGVYIRKNGDIYRYGSDRYYEVYNQRKIQQLLEPYWIDKPDIIEVTVKVNGKECDPKTISQETWDNIRNGS
jgi:hypothetical protein